MKFLQIVSGAALAIASVSAQVLSINGDFNITNPQSNYPYAAGKILPVTYDLFQETSADLKLVISLAGSNTTLIIVDGADVSKSAASALTNNNVTVYEHTYNFNLPATLAAGSYSVVFHDNSTDTQTQIPITILAYTSTTSSSVAAATSAAAATASASGSSAAAAATTSAGATIPKSGAQALIPSKAALSLAAVAVFAYFF